MNRFIQVRVAIKEPTKAAYEPDRTIAESTIDVPLPTDGKGLVETITSTVQQLAANVARHRPEEKPTETPWVIGEPQTPESDDDSVGF